MRLTGSRTYYTPSPPKMPPGLVELMEGMTKEVLKHNPSEIYSFCAHHMQYLLEKRDGPSNVKPLSLEEKIAKAQNRVRQRAEKRIQEFDNKTFIHEHHNIASREKHNASLSHSSQIILLDNSNNVNLESKDNLILPQEHTEKMFLKAPVYHEYALEKSSELEVCQEPRIDDLTQNHEHGDTTPNKNDEVNVNLVLTTPDSNTKTNITDEKHANNLQKTELGDVEASLLMPVEQTKSLIENKDTKDVTVTEQEQTMSSITPQTTDPNVENANEKVEPETVKVDKDAVIICSEKALVHLADTTQSNADTTPNKNDEVNVNLVLTTPDSDTKTNTTDEKHANNLQKTELDDVEAVLLMPVEQTENIIENKDTKDVTVTEQEQKMSSITPQTTDPNVENENEKVEPETIKVDKDAVIIFSEQDLVHLTDTTQNNADMEIKHSRDILNTDNIVIEPKEHTEFDASVDEALADNDPTPCNVEQIAEIKQETVTEVDCNTVIANLDDVEVTPRLGEPGKSYVHDSHTDDSSNVGKVNKEKLGSHDTKSAQNNSPDVDGCNSDTNTSKEPEFINHTTNNLPVVEDSSVGVPASDVKDVNFNSNFTEQIKLNSAHSGSRIDPPVIVTSCDTSIQILGNSVNDVSHIAKSMNANSAPYVDKEAHEKNIEVLSVSVDKGALSPPLNFDTAQIREKNSMDLHTSSSGPPSYISEVINYDDRENDSSLHENDDNERDNLHNAGMDLETAAITIQKVFRSFLFKSRGSTLEDTANDETIFLDDDINNKEKCDFPIESALSIDRRHGITRMDTVLQTVNEEKSLSLSTDDSSTLSSAATIIQAHVRGFLLRNKLNSTKTNNSLNASNSNEPTVPSLDADNELQSKTVLNIHIVPESGDDLSRDESFITSMELSLDSPSSMNLHPSNEDKSERRRRLKREDAIQSVSPPSNNSGKLSEDMDSVKEIVADVPLNESNIIKNDLHSEHDESISTENLFGQTEEINKVSVDNIDSNVIDDINLNQKRKSLTKMNSDERDVVSPFLTKDESGLKHSGEFHDAVVPTKVSRSDTSVVSGE